MHVELNAYKNSTDEPSQVLIENLLSSAPVLSPEIIRQYPKAPPRRKTSKGRKKGRLRILTDTPKRLPKTETLPYTKQKIFNKRINPPKNLVTATVSSSTCMHNKRSSCLQNKISLNFKDKLVVYTEKLKTEALNH